MSGGASGESGAGGGDQEDILAKFIFDEAFVKAAAVKEESARTRELRAQWKKEPPKSEAWRSWEAGPSANYDGLRASQPGSASDPYVTRKRNPRGRRWRSVRRVIALMLVFLMVAGIYSFYSHRRIVVANVPVGINPSLTAMPTMTSAQVAATPTGSCFPTEPGCGSMATPYAGSPAATWADGAAGIVPPAATATGDFSASQVQSALTLSKQFVIDQALVPDVLADGAPPSAMVALMAPKSTVPAELDSWFAHPTSTDDPSYLAVRFDPKTAVLLTTPKVSGTMTYSLIKSGELEVDVSFKVVYALKKPDGSAWTRSIADVGDKLRFYNGDGGFQSTTGSVWPYGIGITSYAGTACSFNGGFAEPWYLLDHENDPNPGGTLVDPYSTATVAPAPTPTTTGLNCSSVSRI